MKEAVDLCLASRVLMNAAQLVLFSIYSNTDLRKNYLYDAGDLAVKESFVQFVLTVVLRADLASRAKAVNIGYAGEEFIERNNLCKRRPSEQDVNILVQRIEEVYVTASDWIARIRKIQQEDILALPKRTYLPL